MPESRYYVVHRENDLYGPNRWEVIDSKPDINNLVTCIAQCRDESNADLICTAMNHYEEQILECMVGD